jgi:hypothetical protein
MPEGTRNALIFLALCVLLPLVILGFKVITTFIQLHRRTIDPFSLKPKLSTHLALLLYTGPAYLSDWKQYRTLRRMGDRLDERNKTKNTTREETGEP